MTDNKLVCSGEKTKLLIIGTPELKMSRMPRDEVDFDITVPGHDVSETSSEHVMLCYVYLLQYIS